MSFSKLLLSAAAAGMLAGPAFADGGPIPEPVEPPPAPAADVDEPAPAPAPAAPYYGWAGFYAGLNAGYGLGSGDGDTSFLPSPASFGAAPFSSSMDIDGFIGGAQAGYNLQFGDFVVGIEADFAWSDMDGSTRVEPLQNAGGTPIPGWYQDSSGELNWFGTARGRAGFLTMPETLVYATGGFAYGRVEYATFTSFTALPPFQYSGSRSATETGWTAGGGIEWAFSANCTLGAEYLYFDLGETNYVAQPLAPNGAFAVTQSFDTSGHILRVRANYRF